MNRCDPHRFFSLSGSDFSVVCCAVHGKIYRMQGILLLEIVIGAVTAAVFLEGLGQTVLDLLKLDHRGFAAPAGAAVYACALEAVFLPCFLLRIPLSAAGWAAAAVTAAGAACALKGMKRLASFRHERDLAALGASGLLFVFVLFMQKDPSAVLRPAEAMIQMAAQGSTAASAQQFQGYTVFGALIMRVFSPSAAAGVMSLLFHLLFAAFFLNLIRSFHLRNPWFAFTLTAYGLFYACFSSWLITSVYSAGGVRLFVIALLLQQICLFLQEKKENLIFLILAAEGAGLFVSDGFDMIAFEIIYCLGVWMFCHHREKTVFHLCVLFSVPLFYKACQLLEIHLLAGVLTGAAGILILYGFRFRRFRIAVLSLEDFLHMHGTAVFGIGVPAALMAGSLLVFLLQPSFMMPFAAYREFLESDPTRGYLFMDGRWTTWVLNGFRLIGLIIVLIRPDGDERSWLRTIYVMMLVLFVNPLTMSFTAKWAGSSAYAATFEIFFNPFTDLVLLTAVYRVFEWQVIGQWVLELFLIAAVLLGNFGSFAGMRTGLYTDQVRQIEPQEVRK